MGPEALVDRRAMSHGSRSTRVVATVAAAICALTTLLPASSTAAVPQYEAIVAAAPGLGFDCQTNAGAVAAADRLMDGTLVLSPHPAATLPANPTWSENPFNDRNWQFQYHTLRFVWDLFAGWHETGDTAMYDRAMFLVRDWIEGNPRSGGASAFSWEDHATAWRTLVLACAYEIQPSEWLRDALVVHAQTLADPGFYRYHSNHALNQDRGLLAAGCVLDNQAWKDLATSRLAALVVDSIDAQGATNEQAIQYQAYNFQMYTNARRELEHCGQPVPAEFSRVRSMTSFMAYSTLPDGTYPLLGDTNLAAAVNVPGTIAEYAATGGVSGPLPTKTFVVYKAGYAFGRTGWGTERAFADEVAWTARFGPGRAWHGHVDHGAVTLYGYGRRLVDDAGILTANAGTWRSFAVGRTAHNVVTVDGVTYDPSTSASAIRTVRGARFDDLTIRDRGYPGVTLERRVVFSHGLGWMYVEDVVTSTRTRTYRQLWHLEPGADPTLSWHTVKSFHPGGNVSIIQLADADSIKLIEGQVAPVQGWMSTTLEDRTAAVTVQTTVAGTTARIVTLLIPKPSSATPIRITEKTLTAHGVKFIVSVGAHRERVSITASTVTITPLS